MQSGNKWKAFGKPVDGPCWFSLYSSSKAVWSASEYDWVDLNVILKSSTSKKKRKEKQDNGELGELHK